MSKQPTKLIDRKIKQKRKRGERNRQIDKSRELVKTTAILLVVASELRKPAYHRQSSFNNTFLVHAIEQQAQTALEDFTDMSLPKILIEYFGKIL